jgi:phosphate transport system substrate-binding protein
MRRTTLLLGLSAAALSAAAQAATTPAIINGGGAASQQFDYAAPDVNKAPVSEFFTFDADQKKVSFGTYWSTTSGAAQTGLLNDDLSCIENKSTGANGGNCYGTVGGASTVHYAVSESVLSSATIAQWATSSVGQAQAGNLIQIPALGTGLAIVFNDTNITSNGQATLSDNDLCEIFSGGYTDFSQIKDSATAPAAGAFKLAYRSDSAGTTFLLTNHLSRVCNAGNTAPGVTFTATSSFATLFTVTPITTQIPGGYPVDGLANLANTMAGLVNGPLPQAISYISPDWTSVDSATSSAKLSNGNPSPLIVASLFNGKTAYLPTAANIKLALTHPLDGQGLNPPSTASQGANPASWVPLIQTVSLGYPIIGYSALDLPQCYANATISAGVKGFLLHHYDSAAYKQIQTNNGLVPVANAVSTRFLKAIRQNILANANGWNTDIGNATACAGKPGR